MVEDVLRLAPDDTLILLGDYIDRGPDSKGVLDYLISLLDNGYDIRPLMGNHEELCLKAVAGDALARKVWFGNGGSMTPQQFGVKSPENIPRQYLDFMAAMPRILVEPDYVLVHAGLDFESEDPLRDTGPQFMLWDRTVGVQPRNIAGRTMVCGHTITALAEIKASRSRSAIYLDNGCFMKGYCGYGSLVALNLDTRELLAQPNCE